MDSMLEWSRAAWRRHLPTVPDINSFVRELGAWKLAKCEFTQIEDL